jgi:hypothetical protein
MWTLMSFSSNAVVTEVKSRRDQKKCQRGLTLISESLILQGMEKQKVIDHYGSQSKVAQAMKVSRQAVAQWDEIIPEASAMKLHLITNGKLEYDPTLYQYKEF